jgi:hypothetical protein
MASFSTFDSELVREGLGDHQLPLQFDPDVVPDKIVGAEAFASGSASSPPADGSVVPVWPDSSPWGNQGTKIGSPIIKLGIANGRPVVRFRSASSDGFNLASALSSDAPWSCFMVMKPSTPTSFLIALATKLVGGNVFTGLFYTDGNFYASTKTGYLNCPSSAFNSDFHVISVNHYSTAGAYFNFRIDGVAVGHTPVGATQTGDFDTIGWLNGGTPFGDGDIAEIVFFPDQLNDTLRVTDRQNIEKTLSANWGSPAPPAGSIIDISTVTGLTSWWKADAILALTGIGGLIVVSAESSVGVSVVTGTSGKLAGANGSSVGVAVPSGASGKISGSTGATAGLGAVVGAGATVIRSTGSATASGAASGVAAYLTAGAGSSTGRSGLLMDEGFEGTGAPPGWFDYSSVPPPDWDYAAAPLVGSQSLRLANTDYINDYQYIAVFLADPDRTEVWFKFRIKFEKIGTAVEGYDYTSLIKLGLEFSYVYLDGRVSIYDNNSGEIFSPPGSIVEGVTYDFWTHLIATPNPTYAFWELSWAKAGESRPTSGNNYLSTNTGLQIYGCSGFELKNYDGGILVIDQFQGATADLFAPMGAAIWDSVGNASGSSTAAAVGEAVSIGSVGSSTGAATANSNSARIVASVSAAAGVSTAQSNSATLKGAVLNTAGLGAATANTAAIWRSIWNTAGAGAAAANTAARWSAVYSSTGLSLVIGLGTDAAATGSDGSTAGLGSAQAISARYVSAAAAGGGVSTVQSQSSKISLAAWVALAAGGAQANSLILFGTVFSSSGYGEGYGFTQTTFCGVGEAEGSALVTGHPFIIPTFEYFLDLEHGAKQSQSGLIGFVANSSITTLRAQSAVEYPRSD